jgi:hypothetical protein
MGEGLGGGDVGQFRGDHRMDAVGTGRDPVVSKTAEPCLELQGKNITPTQPSPIKGEGLKNGSHFRLAGYLAEARSLLWTNAQKLSSIARDRLVR